MSEHDVSRQFSEPKNPISFDPYVVWRTLVLANPDMMLFVSEKRDLYVDPSIGDFALSISVFPDDLQDLLFTFAQHHGVAKAHRALDQAVETAYRIEREAWLKSATAAAQKTEPAARQTTQPQPECDAA